MIRTLGVMVLVSLAGLGLASTGGGARPASQPGPGSAGVPTARADFPVVKHRTVEVDGVKIFYREAGPSDAPAILLLHGFPSSSSMFRELIPRLAERYRVIAPDYPGFGQSDMPARDGFKYSFDHLSTVVDAFTRKVGLERFAMYVQDYGAPIGYRIAQAHPERITGIIVQNGNAYEEGIDNDFWKPIKLYWAEPTPEHRDALRPFLKTEGTRWQYTHGARDVASISPDGWTIDQHGLDRPGNDEIQLDLFLSYGTNPRRYPEWQAYFREHQPPMLIVWGQRDQIFPPAGAEPYKRDLKNVDFNLLDTGHFALEEEGPRIAEKIRVFMRERVEPALGK